MYGCGCCWRFLTGTVGLMCVLSDPQCKHRAFLYEDLLSQDESTFVCDVSDSLLQDMDVGVRLCAFCPGVNLSSACVCV